MLILSSQSTQYVPVALTASADPTSFPVSFAFLGPYATQGQASDAVPDANTIWYTGSWGAPTSAPVTYPALCLIGPGEDAVVQLSAGTYIVYVMVQASPEIPILWSGPMSIY